ncbi:BamA/OMP85 family outer membrane protein [Gaopeijia maritima]|uniref:BamA/OMP85 family outer membrane protein n=1 Tax=Gaopeijia maritima TaxID=3119007 RepID=UPI00328A5118
MPTEPATRASRAPGPATARGRRLVAGLFAALLTLAAPPQLRAQAPLFLIDADTRVSSVTLEFPESRTLDPKMIRQRVALRGPTFAERLQGALDVLPFVGSPSLQPFVPLELARDAARIERYYRDNGFLGPDTEYEVQLDTTSNRVRVTYLVHEGRPILVDTVVVVPGPETTPLDSTLNAEWARFLNSLRGEHGSRLGEVDRVRLRSRPLDWLRTRGYAFAQVRDTVQVDTATASARVEIRYDPGPRARVDSIVVEGREALEYNTVVREIPLKPGDWFNVGRMAEGQRQVFGLDLVRLALFDVAPDQPRDSTVTLRLRLQEGRRRAIGGETGYATERGAVAEARWEHRDFLGGARTFTVSGVANTGWLAATDEVDRRFGASVSLRQPWLLDHRLSGTLRPFVEYRDDTRDESRSFGADLSLLFERGSLDRASVTYTISTRQIIDAPTLAVRGDTPDTLLLSALPVDVGDVHTSRIGLDLVYGEVDDPVGPREGYIARLGTEIAGPEGLSNVQYGRIDGSLTGFWPVNSSIGLVARLSGGRLFPWGESVPGDSDDILVQLLRLRDAVFTAGGTGDVRGWGTGQLGPKVPDLRLVEQGDSVVASADRWLVLAGLARVTGSLEVRLPFPGLGPDHGTHLFLDAGRVWTSDDRFLDPALPRDPLDQERVFYGAGAGVEFGTLVGPLRIDVGYKLNPSPLDLRDPDAVAKALVAGEPIQSVPTSSLARWHLHIAVGRVY